MDVSNEHKRIPSLDGWRAISIIIVLIGHQIQAYSFSHNTCLTYFDFASHGVQIFFVISGFLITNLLIKEEKKTNKISLKNFYIRRIFRIFPAFFIFLIFTDIINISLGQPIDQIIWIKSAFFLANFGDNGIFTHIWSLSVEEQYYLFWPVIFKSKKSNTLLPLLFILLVPILMLLNSRGIINMTRFNTLMNVDSIFIGALFAMYQNHKLTKFIEKFRFPIVFISITFLIAEKIHIPHTAIITVPFTHTLFALSIVLLINRSMDHATLLYRCLNKRFLIFIGQLSYSLYLWQQIFIYINPLIPMKFACFPFNFMWIFIFAYLSSKLIELPFLRLRHRILPLKY